MTDGAPPKRDKAGTVYIGRRLQYHHVDGTPKAPIRYADMQLDPPPNGTLPMLAEVKGEVVLRETPSGRRNLKAVFTEPERGIGGLDIFHYSKDTGNIHKSTHVKIYGNELGAMLSFIRTMQEVKIPGPGRLTVDPGAMDNPRFVQDSDVLEAVRKNPGLLKQLVQNPDLDQDIKAIGYWRKSLDTFRQFISSPSTPEKEWQDFFEANRWIFGYGLLYISTQGVYYDKLEQTVKGGSVTGGGSRPDALLKTRGALSALCLAEIKTHSTPLVSQNMRGGTYLISKELSDAVSQCQTAVSVVEEQIRRKFEPTDEHGFPTSDPIYNFRPRSLLVIGNTSEFIDAHDRVSEDRFRTFEMYRRNLISPEIITFDELLDRATSLVENKI